MFSPFPAAWALGFASQIIQIVLLRELLAVFHGNELSLGIILAAWMFWVGIGSQLAPKVYFLSYTLVFGSRIVNNTLTILLTTGALLIVSIVSVCLIRLLRGFFSIETGAWFSVGEMALACIIILAPVGFLLGFQFIMTAKIWRGHDGVQDTSSAEKTYIGEAFGTMIGGLWFSLLLVHYVNSFQAIVLSVLVMMFSIIWLLYRQTDKRVYLKVVWYGMLIMSVLSFIWLHNLDLWTYKHQWKLFSPEYQLVETTQSKYGPISVVQREDQYSFFQSGNLIFSTAGSGDELTAFEEQDAVIFAHFAMVQHPHPQQVLLIGGGLRGTLREMIKHPVSRIDYIELDPQLIAAARSYLPESTLKAFDSPIVNVIHQDGRLLVKNTQQLYDLIIVDLPDPATAVLNRYYTAEFFREVKARLAPGGVFVTGVISTADMRSQAAVNRNAAIYHTLRQVYADVLPAGQRFLFFSASDVKGQISAEPAVLKARYLKRHIDTIGFSARQFDLLMEESRLRRVNWIIRNHGRQPQSQVEPPNIGPLFPDSIANQQLQEAYLPPVNERYFINTDFKPIGYFYTLQFWNTITKGAIACFGQRGIFGWIIQVQLWWVVLPVILCLCFMIVLKNVTIPNSHADQYAAIMLAVFSTGFSTMSLQVALILAFQSLYGFVYEMIGVITALFMGGLAGGTYISHKLIQYKSNFRWLGLTQLFIGLYALCLAIALPQTALLNNNSLIIFIMALLIVGAGIFNGIDFPLTTACCQALSQQPEKAAGTVYGVELFGACTGALAASVLIAPVLGISAVVTLAAITNLTAFMAILISGTDLTCLRRFYAKQG